MYLKILLIVLAVMCFLSTGSFLFLILLFIIPFLYEKEITEKTTVYGGNKFDEHNHEHSFSKKFVVSNGGNMRENGEMDKKSKNWVDSLSLIDPRFNMREAAKQMILLEDHLFHNNKHCLDCVSKHTLFIEGLLEEGVAMDSDNKYRKELLEVLTKIKELMPPLIEKMKLHKATEKDYVDAANQLRQIRKPIAKGYSFYKV